MVKSSNPELIAKHLSKVLLTNQVQGYNDGLFSGRAGLAIFLCSCSNYFNSPTYASKSREILEEAISGAATSPTVDVSLGYGVVGIAISTRYLFESGIIQNEDLDWILEVDEVIDYCIDHLKPSDDLSLSTGATGICLYLLMTKRYDRIVKVISVLEEGFHEGGGVKAWGEIKKNSNNLGIPHGCMGVVLLLISLCEHGLESKRTYPLLERAIIELLTIYPSESFPSTLTHQGIPSGQQKFGWCHGDVAKLLTLVRANKILLAQKVDQEISAINSRINKLTAPSDANFCHGFSGLLTVFTFLHRITGEIHYQQTARKFRDQLICHFNPIQCKTGFIGFNEEGPDNASEANFGLLNGAGGIGMALLQNKMPSINFLNKIFLLEP